MKIEGRRQRLLVIWGRLLAVSALLFLFDAVGKLRFVRSGAEWLLFPLVKVTGAVHREYGQGVRQVKFVRTGALRLVDLEREVGELVVNVSRVDELERENENLREQLGVLSSDYEYEVAEVLLIEGGDLVVSFSGVKPQVGWLVLWKDGLVGYVESVGEWIARVRTVRGFEIELAVDVKTSNGVKVGEGYVRGDVVSGIVLDKVLQEVDLRADLLVVSKGMDDRVPKGTVVGTVSTLLSGDADVYQRAQVKPILEPVVGDMLYVVMEEDK